MNGVPLINGYGNSVLGPGELYDRNNQVFHGVLDVLSKDNMANPIKIFLNENEENKKDNLDEYDDEKEEVIILLIIIPTIMFKNILLIII